MDHIWYWFAYSFLGYCLEKLFAAATSSSHRLRRCFVFLPLCPVYGFAMVTILLLGAEKLPGAWEQILLGSSRRRRWNTPCTGAMKGCFKCSSGTILRPNAT